MPTPSYFIALCLAMLSLGCVTEEAYDDSSAACTFTAEHVEVGTALRPLKSM
jgi:hypothetical protein